MPAIIDFKSSGATHRQPSFLKISNIRRTGSTCTSSAGLIFFGCGLVHNSQQECNGQLKNEQKHGQIQDSACIDNLTKHGRKPI